MPEVGNEYQTLSESMRFGSVNLLRSCSHHVRQQKERNICVQRKLSFWVHNLYQALQHDTHSSLKYCVQLT
jgi:hypothetical protein